MFFQMLLLVNGLESQMFHSCLEKLGWGLSTLCFIVRPSKLDKKVIVKRQKKEFFSTAPKGRKKSPSDPQVCLWHPSLRFGFQQRASSIRSYAVLSGCGSTNTHHPGSSLSREVARQGGRAAWNLSGDQFLLWRATDCTLPFSHYETPGEIPKSWCPSLQ